MLIMVNALQLTLHLPIMSTVAPANVIAMWNIIIPVVMFDIIEKIPWIQEIFPDSENEMEENSEVLD